MKRFDFDERESQIAQHLKVAATIRSGAIAEYAKHDAANENLWELDKDLPPYTTILVYMYKHWTGIRNWIVRDAKDQRDTIQGRVYDLINYLLIFLTMLDEDRLTRHESKPH